MAEDDLKDGGQKDGGLNAGGLAAALAGRAVEGFSVDAQGGTLRLGLTGLLLELEGVDALFLEGLGAEGKIAYVGLWDGPATGEAAEDLELAQELLRIEEEKDPFSGGRIVIQLEPEADAGLHLVARFAAASVEEYDAPEGDSAWVAISVMSDADWAALCDVVDVPALRAARFATLAGRVAHLDEIDGVLADWCASRAAPEVAAALQAVGVAAAVTATAADLAVDAQLAAWDHFQTQPRGDGSPAHYEACRFQLSVTPGEVRRAAPVYGRDTEAVLRDWLGYDAARIAALQEAGALT